MYRSLLASVACLAATSVGAPLAKRDVTAPPGGDISILNYALALEYLERKFYQETLDKFNESDFCNAGLDSKFYGNLQSIYKDEQTHVDFLAGALGDKAIGEPTFSFPLTDVHSFLGLSSVLEGVGVSAYLGAAPAIADKTYLTAAGSILTVEARHASYIRAASKEKPFPAAFDTPLGFNQVFSLAAQFVTGFAPGTDLPFKAFPALTATDAAGNGYKAGESQVTFAGAHKNVADAGKVDANSNVFAVFYSGLQAYYVPVTVSGDDYVVTVPGANYAEDKQPAPAGQVYVVLSTADGSKENMANDENTVSGVGILEVM